MAITRAKLLEIARTLPAAPRVFAGLDRLLRDHDSDLKEIGVVIKRDAALAAHIIRMSNSVVYGGEQPTGSIEEAVSRVGFTEVHRLVGFIAGAQLAERPLTYYGIDADQLREHMLFTAFLCEELARECALDPRSAYTAGLMRPLGLLVLDRVADDYEGIVAYHPMNDRDYLVWEGRLFGMASCEVAALILAEWSFPAEIVEAIRHHYLLQADDTDCRLACLLNLAGALGTDDGHALIGELRHWGDLSRKFQALDLDPNRAHAAADRARQGFAHFQRRLSDSESAPASRAAKPIPEPRAAEPAHGAMTVDSCNFPIRVRVLVANDEPPVHTPPSGLTPPADFPTFMRAYQDMVFSTAARLTRNDAQAEDIAQEVFIKAHEHFEQLRTSPTAGGWLKTVATNLSLNHLSRYRNRWKFFSEFKRDRAGDDEPEVEFAAPDSFFSNVDASERHEWIERALDQLPEHQRVPLVLYHFEDLPYEEIARQLRISLAKVKTDILRARAALAKILQRSGTEHEKLTS